MKTWTKGRWSWRVGIGMLCAALLPSVALGSLVKTQTLGTTTETNAGSLNTDTKICTFLPLLQSDDDLQTAYVAGAATITKTSGTSFSDPYSRVVRLADAASSTVFHGTSDGCPWPENHNDHNFLAAGGDYNPTPLSVTYDIKFLDTYTGYRTLQEINVFHGFNQSRDPYDFDIYYSTTADPTTFHHIVTAQNSDMNNNVLIQTVFDTDDATDVDTIRFVIRSTEIPGAGYFGNAFPEIDINFQAPEPATLGLLTVGGLGVLFRRKR
jgi:hypothetical protein